MAAASLHGRQDQQLLLVWPLRLLALPLVQMPLVPFLLLRVLLKASCGVGRHLRASDP